MHNSLIRPEKEFAANVYDAKSNPCNQQLAKGIDDDFPKRGQLKLNLRSWRLDRNLPSHWINLLRRIVVQRLTLPEDDHKASQLTIV